MQLKYGCIHPNGFCPVFIGVDEHDRLVRKISYSHPKNLEHCETPLLSEALAQLHAYFKGNLKTFDLPIYYEGTPFQEKVWNALREIPYGNVRSYKDIANMIDNPRAVRAVGMANNRNPIPIVVPCHRVINHNGQIGGYAPGVTYKKFLLNLEKMNI